MITNQKKNNQQQILAGGHQGHEVNRRRFRLARPETLLIMLDIAEEVEE